jgi:zinc transporter 9
MTTHRSNKSVLYAFTGNLVITVLKFIGYFITFSPSFFSEALHSVADTCNQGLLLLGIKRSKKKADENFQYGYGAERFFWAVVSACGIFFLGAGVTIFHGIESLSHATKTEISWIAFLILGISFLVESFTLYKAYKEIYRDKEESFLENLENADPVSIAVFYEDLVAVLGIIVAFTGIVISHVTGNIFFDAVGSIVIGLLLGVAAILLLNINRKFLLGKSIPKKVAKEIIQLLEEDPHIEKVIDFKSEVLDIGRYHIKCEIEFNGYALVEDIFESEDMEENWEEVKNDYEQFKKFVIYQTNQAPRLVGRVIDNLEKEIMNRYPSIIHIDLEIN